MIRIRVFEERCAELYAESKIRGFLHLYIGEEAVAAGVMRALDPDDNVLATYREHGHALLRGVPAESIMAEMFGRATGCSGGRGGSMHLFDADTGSTAAMRSSAATSRSPSGSPSPTRCRAADAVTVCFFGEGAMAEGEFHEAMNLAALWNLPVLFCCENNRYAMGTSLEIERVADRPGAQGRGLRDAGVGRRRDGRPRSAPRRPASRSRRSSAAAGPVFIEFQTYRFRAHSMFDPELYRTRPRSNEWKSATRSTRSAGWLVERGRWSRRRGRRAVGAARSRDRAGGRGRRRRRRSSRSRGCSTRHRLAPSRGLARGADDGHDHGHRPTPTPVADAETTYREAMRAAIREALADDDRVIVLGEDVADYGGTYAVTKGLLEEFGRDRVRNTRCRSRASSAPASAQRSAGCDRSSRS